MSAKIFAGKRFKISGSFENFFDRVLVEHNIHIFVTFTIQISDTWLSNVYSDF